MSGRPVKRASYTMKFKINAVKYAKETNVSVASRKFEVDKANPGVGPGSFKNMFVWGWKEA